MTLKEIAKALGCTGAHAGNRRNQRPRHIRGGLGSRGASVTTRIGEDFVSWIGWSGQFPVGHKEASDAIS
jgi:hypothetical protein